MLQEARLAVARKWHRVAILYVNDAYGRGHADAFVPAFRALGGEVVLQDPVTDTTTDFDVFVRAYKASRPDAVFVICGTYSYRAFLRAAAAQHLPSQIFGGDGWASSLATEPYADGVMWPSMFLLNDTATVAVQFRTAFRRRFNREPDAVSAMAYDAARALLEAIRRGGDTRQGVREALASPGVLAIGATGPISFRRGDRVGGVGGGVRVRDGAIHTDMRWNELR
ncbi:MAG: ABC transporter substrate-binding protein [bacterium]